MTEFKQGLCGCFGDCGVCKYPDVYRDLTAGRNHFLLENYLPQSLLLCSVVDRASVLCLRGARSLHSGYHLRSPNINPTLLLLKCWNENLEVLQGFANICLHRASIEFDNRQRLVMIQIVYIF